jgi:hypothetical protein
MSGDDGQATVELVAFLPLLLVIALAAAAVLAGQVAGEQAGQAAEAGALARLQGADPRGAARRALPPSARRRTRIDVHGDRITVHVRPNLPLAALEAPLTGTATAATGSPAAP